MPSEQECSTLRLVAELGRQTSPGPLSCLELTASLCGGEGTTPSLPSKPTLLPKGSRVVVTGADGYLGSWVVAFLLERLYTVIGTVRQPSNQGKVGHLWALPGARQGRLELVEAHLEQWGSFEGAIRGREAHAVIHTASPFFLTEISDYEKELVAPCYDGTLNVLETCSKAPSVKRVVLTSSTAAVLGSPQTDPSHVWTEKDWSEPELLRLRKAWFPLAKTKAERAAWQYMSVTKPTPQFDLVVINPTMMIGPALQPRLNASLQFLLGYLAGGRTKIPRTCMSFVGVQTAALAHILALQDPSAEGRHLCVSASLTSDHIFAVLRRACPKAALPSVCGEGLQEPLTEYDTSKLKALGLKFDSVVDSLLETVESLRKFGFLTPIEGPPPEAEGGGPAVDSPSKTPGPLVALTTTAGETSKVVQMGNRPVYLQHDVSTALIEEDELQQLFETFTVDGAGRISKAEFKEFYLSMDSYGLDEDDKKVEEWINYARASEEDTLTFDEFAILMLKIAQR